MKFSDFLNENQDSIAKRKLSEALDFREAINTVIGTVAVLMFISVGKQVIAYQVE